jgi:hypothetical protein
VPLPDDDRRAVAARLVTTAPAATDVLAAALGDDEELREVLVDVDGDVVAFTARRAVFVRAGGTGDARSFGYGDIEVRRREDGLGIDALIEGHTLVLDVARATFVRLGVVAQGAPPGRATWLPVRVKAPERPVLTEAPDRPTEQLGVAVTNPFSRLPPPGWHPDPSGRHWWRWWDGRDWTDHVADGGAPYLDPLPPR